MSDDTARPPTVVSLRERREARSKAEDDEFLFGLAERLKTRAERAEAAGDREMAIEMRAASEAVLPGAGSPTAEHYTRQVSFRLSATLALPSARPLRGH